MPTPTTRRALPKPLGTESPDGPAQIGALADLLDFDIRGFSGLESARAAFAPTVGAGWVSGDRYLSTDTGVEWIRQGSGFVAVNPKDAAANVASMRTLGAGALQAAAGTHSHPVVLGFSYSGAQVEAGANTTTSCGHGLTVTPRSNRIYAVAAGVFRDVRDGGIQIGAGGAGLMTFWVALTSAVSTQTWGATNLDLGARSAQANPVGSGWTSGYPALAAHGALITTTVGQALTLTGAFSVGNTPLTARHHGSLLVVFESGT